MIGIEHLFIDDAGPPSRAKRWTRALLVLSFCGLFVGISYGEHEKALKLASWSRISCRITGSEVASMGAGRYRHDPYRARVTFEYLIGQQRFARAYESGGTTDAAEAYAVRDAYPKGLIADCFVNPRAGGEAVLIRPSVTQSTAFFTGALFVTAVVLWFYCLPQMRGTAKPIGGKSARRRWFVIVMVVAMSGLFGTLLVHEYVIPSIGHVRCQSWPAVPCTVVESNITGHELGGEIHFWVYRTDIHFRYLVGGTEYHSNRYSFTEDGTFFASIRERLSQAFPHRFETRCFVNPQDPREAVLARHLSPGIVNAVYPMSPVFIILGVVLAMLGFKDRQHHVRALACRWAFVAYVVGLLSALVWAQLAAP